MPDEKELRLREARVEGAEHAIQALRDASLDLQRTVDGLERDLRSLENRQARHLYWTLGTILGLGGIITAIVITLTVQQSGERRALDMRISDGLAVLQQRSLEIGQAIASVEQRTGNTDDAVAAIGQTSERLAAEFGDLRDDLAETDHRHSTTLGRLSANIDSIRSDFGYLVDGGGTRSLFEGQILLQVPYESADADFTGAFLSDIELALLFSGGKVRVGSLGVTMPRHGRIPRRWIVYAINREFIDALADELAQESSRETDIAARLIASETATQFLAHFHELAAWPTLASASLDGSLNAFVIESRALSDP